MRAEFKLRKLLDQIAKEANYGDCNIQMKEISTDGASYTSILFLITISSPNKEDLKLFAKFANMSEEVRDTMPLGISFENEWIFYDKIVNKFRKLEKNREVPKDEYFVIPKLYGSCSKYLEETLVLEDLSDRGYTIYDRKKPITWEYATTAIRHLAKLHALSFAYAQEYPEEFNKLKDLLRFPMGGEMFKDIYFNRLISVALKTIKEENRQKLRKYFEENDRYQDFLSCYKPVTRAVFSHGDYRASNLMHRFHDDKMEIIAVDYQAFHIGCPAIDLLFLIYTGSDGEFRKLYYEKLLLYYYDHLNLALQRLNMNINDVYPRECYDKDLKALEMFGLYLAVTVLVIVTVEVEDAPEISLNVEFKASELYRQRLNEVVDEYVAMGLL